MVKKFNDLGLRIKYNTEDTVLRYKRWKTEVPAFSRVFIQDNAGKGGPLYRATRYGLKDEPFSAQYTADWLGHPGSWWHVDASNIDFDALYDFIANA